MKILKSGTATVEKIIYRKSLSDNSLYKLSQFTLFYEENDSCLLRNMMTGEVISLSQEEKCAVRELISSPRNYGFLVDNGLTELAMKRYIVQIDCDELKQYQQTVFLMKTISGKKKGLTSYIIFPTTGCNARCIYCFEEGYAVHTMSQETADKVVEFICKTKHDGKILLHWFGGEPLAAANTIQHICRKLQENGVEFSSQMVTNASLVTKEMAQEARELWHLERVQVSLDGAKEDYTLRKAYYRPDKHNYDVVMQSIHYLINQGINVNLRVNVDFENIVRISGFLKDIRAEFDDMEHLSLYLTPLYQAQKSERIMELYQEIFRLYDIQKKIGIPFTRRENPNTGVRLNYCMADSMDSCVVITPLGVLNNCEHLPEGNSWGNVYDGVTDEQKFSALKKTMPVDERCAKCTFLPMCTPFFKNGCDSWFDKCSEYRRMSMEFSLHNLLSGSEQDVCDAEEI